MFKVKTLLPWEDLKAGVLRKPNFDTAIFECDKERYEELQAKLPIGYIELIEEVKEDEPKKVVKKTKKK